MKTVHVGNKSIYMAGLQHKFNEYDRKDSIVWLKQLLHSMSIESIN